MEKRKRVVVTGWGVASPIGNGEEFASSWRKGTNGIRSLEELNKLGFRCTIGGQAHISEEEEREYFPRLLNQRIPADGIRFGLLAAIQAYRMSGLEINRERDPHTGCIIGTGMAGSDLFAKGVQWIDEGKVKRLGSKTLPNAMGSGVSAFIGGHLGLGNQVSTNSSACATGTEAIVMGMDRLLAGKARRMLCGSCESGSPYVRGGFDAMRVLNAMSNDLPEKGSCPMNAGQYGFIPSSGGGVVMLETLQSARERGAPIFCELKGGEINSGGQREGGTLTAPNPSAVYELMERTIRNSGWRPEEIDLVSGHLTGTAYDHQEVKLWTQLFEEGKHFPYLQAPKSMIGHCLSAAGSIEAIGLILQLKGNYLHPNFNAEPLHPEIINRWPIEKITLLQANRELKKGISASFGFGDVNAIVAFEKWEESVQF